MATMIFDHDGYKAFEMRGGGVLLRSPKGTEVFCQPGDDASTMRDNLQALEEDGLEVSGLVDAVLSDYFTQ